METLTLRDTIKKITANHLENNGLIMGQCLSAVGWVNGTVPNIPKGIVELPMTDVAGAGFAVGAAVAGRRPILVLRFGDFLLLNNSPIFNFAAKRKDVFGKAVPLFVRVISQEGKGTGLSHSGKPHALAMHYPGMRVWCPTTPDEYQACWNDFMTHDDPMLCFEHRATYDNTYARPDVIMPDATFTIFATSYARTNAESALNLLSYTGLRCNLVHLYKLKPFTSFEMCKDILKGCKAGLVIDTSFEICGASRDIAYQLMYETGIRVKALGLEDVSVGCSKETENATPDVLKIVKTVKDML